MNAVTDSASPLSRTLTIILALAVFALLAVYCWFAASNPYSGSYSDAVRYLFMADSFQGVSDPLTVRMSQESMFPPLFPLLLAALGAGTSAITAGHLVTFLTLALACAAMYWWLAGAKLSVNERLLAVALLLLLPGLFLTSLMVLSEFLFMALVLASLAAMAKAENSVRWVYAAALLAGLAIITRTVGIALLPVLLLAARLAGTRRLAVALVLALAPVIAWRLLRDTTYASTSYFSLFAGYLGQLTFSDFIRNLGLQLGLMWQNWILMFDSYLTTRVAWVQSFILAVACVVFLARLRRLRSDAVFLAAYLGIIVFWPFPHELQRFLLVCLPFFLFYCILAVNHVLARRWIPADDRLLKPAFVAIFLLTVLPSLLFFQHRFQIPADEELKGHRFTHFWYKNLPTDILILETTKLNRVYEMARAINGEIGAEDCVYTTTADVVSLYSGRRGVNLPRDMYDGLESGSTYDLSRLDECDYVLMVGLSIRQFPEYTPMYPMDALSGRLEPMLLSNVAFYGTDYTAAAFAEIDREPGSADEPR